MGKANQKRSLKIDIYSILQDLVRNIPYILFAGISAALIMYIAIKGTYTPVYETQTTFAVSVRGSADSVYSNFATTSNMAKMFEQILTSSVLRDKVSEEVGEQVSLENVTAYRIPETNLLSLSVQADAPEKAYQIIKSVMNNYGSISEYMMGNAIMEVLDEPKMPAAPKNPQNIRNSMEKAALVGMLLLAAFIVWLSYMRDTVKNADEVEEKLEGSLLGIIWHEKKNKSTAKKKTSILITNPTAGFLFAEGYRKLATKIDYKCKKYGYKTIMVTSVLSNEGKSTVAANLALALAKRKKKVLLVDADLRKPAQNLIFDYPVEKQQDMLSYFNGTSDLSQIITYNEPHKIYMLCTTKSYNRSNEILLSEKMQEILQYGREHMDYIIVDTPPMAMVADAEATAGIVDASIMVVRKNFALTRDINDASDALRRCQAEYLGNIYNAERKLPFNATGDIRQGNAYQYGGKD